MTHRNPLFAVLGAVLGLSALGLGGCNWLQARDNLNNGIRAYRESNYASAVEYFQQALELDPDVQYAQLYLAMAYQQQFIPNSLDPQNRQFADLALQEFDRVLEREPENTTALAGLANIYQNTDRLDDARETYLRQAELQPDDAVAHYSVGSINWNIVTNRAPELVGIQVSVPGLGQEEGEEMTEEERAAEVAELSSLIEEGQQHLDRALELRPTYEDAMTYKNLLYRQAAGLIPEDTEDQEALARREELESMADEWFNRALETRQRNAELAAAGLPVE